MEPDDPVEHMRIATVDGVIWIKFFGRADFKWSVQFKNVMTELWRRGHRRFILEMRDCSNLDSTFIADLIQIGRTFAEENRQRPDAAFLQLANPNSRVLESIESIGVSQFFKVIQTASPGSENFGACLETDTPSRLETTRNCWKAHQFLGELSEENQARFKDVVGFLAEDLKRLEEEEKRKEQEKEKEEKKNAAQTKLALEKPEQGESDQV